MLTSNELIKYLLHAALISVVARYTPKTRLSYTEAGLIGLVSVVAHYLLNLLLTRLNTVVVADSDVDDDVEPFCGSCGV